MLDFGNTLDPQALVSLLLGSRRGSEYVARADLDTALVRAGRNNEPYIVSFMHDFGALSPDDAPALVYNAWNAAEWPQDSMPARMWRELFEFAGYAVDGEPAARPANPLALFRGAPVKYRRRWSWTPERELAEWFARRAGDRFGLPESHVWTATVEPHRLWAENIEMRQAEHEFIVDTRGLRITTV